MKLNFRTDCSGLCYLILIALALFLIPSCQESDELGLEVTREGERFTYRTDSSTRIMMATLRQDSLTAEKRSAVLLGHLENQVFGKSSASFLTQLRLSSNEVAFGDQIELDSAILILKYQSYYGDTTSMQHIKVYEMTDDLVYDSTYYSNLDLSSYYDPNAVIGELSYQPEPNQDSLAIFLNESIGLKILNADTSNLTNNAAFLEYFKGLYIEASVDQGPGAMIYFDLAGGTSRLSLFYSNAQQDSLQYDVLINTNATWVNLFRHDYAGSELAAQIVDTLYDQKSVYLQAMSGLRAGIKIEFSDSLLSAADEGIAINKAELIFPVAAEYSDDLFTKPSGLSIFGAKADGTNEFIDDLFLGEAYYGGAYSAEDQAFVFNVARHVQHILDPDPTRRLENLGLFLVVNDARVTANQVVLRNHDPVDMPRLIITYTLID